MSESIQENNFKMEPIESNLNLTKGLVRNVERVITRSRVAKRNPDGAQLINISLRYCIVATKMNLHIYFVNKCGCVALFKINPAVRSFSGTRRRSGSPLNVIAPFIGP